MAEDYNPAADPSNNWDWNYDPYTPTPAPTPSPTPPPPGGGYGGNPTAPDPTGNNPNPWARTPWVPEYGQWQMASQGGANSPGYSYPVMPAPPLTVHHAPSGTTFSLAGNPGRSDVTWDFNNSYGQTSDYLQPAYGKVTGFMGATPTNRNDVLSDRTTGNMSLWGPLQNNPNYNNNPINSYISDRVTTPASALGSLGGIQSSSFNPYNNNQPVPNTLDNIGGLWKLIFGASGGAGTGLGIANPGDWRSDTRFPPQTQPKPSEYLLPGGNPQVLQTPFVPLAKHGEAGYQAAWRLENVTAEVRALDRVLVQHGKITNDDTARLAPQLLEMWGKDNSPNTGAKQAVRMMANSKNTTADQAMIIVEALRQSGDALRLMPPPGIDQKTWDANYPKDINGHDILDQVITDDKMAQIFSQAVGPDYNLIGDARAARFFWNNYIDALPVQAFFNNVLKNDVDRVRMFGIPLSFDYGSFGATNIYSVPKANLYPREHGKPPIMEEVWLQQGYLPAQVEKMLDYARKYIDRFPQGQPSYDIQMPGILRAMDFDAGLGVMRSIHNLAKATYPAGYVKNLDIAGYEGFEGGTALTSMQSMKNGDVELKPERAKGADGKWYYTGRLTAQPRTYGYNEQAGGRGSEVGLGGLGGIPDYKAMYDVYKFTGGKMTFDEWYKLSFGKPYKEPATTTVATGTKPRKLRLRSVSYR